MGAANRLCKVCLDTKPLDAFSVFVNPDGRKGVRYTCARCRTDKIRQATASSPQTYLRSWLRRGSTRGKGREINLTLEDLLQQWDSQSGRCAVTHMAMTYSPKSLRLGTGLNASVDRIDPDKHYTPQNIRLVCHRVNVMRSTSDDSELKWWCQQIMQGLVNDK